MPRRIRDLRLRWSPAAAGEAARRWRLPLALFAAPALIVCAVYAMSIGGWYRTHAETDPEYGLNYSCKRAQFFGEDCAGLLAEILDTFGVRHIRVSAYWSDIEGEPGVYDFHAIDEMLAIAQAHDVAVTVTIGMKAQRFPEFWFPTWLRLAANLPPDVFPEDNPRIAAALFPFLSAAAAHIGASPAVEAIQVENEPFVHYQGHANGWRIRKPFLAREIEAVRAADPGRHPIVVSHASWLRRDDTWRWILANADVLSQSVYTKRQRGPWPWLYIFPYRIGPLTPNLPGQAQAARRADDSLWIGELQAEPYEQPTIDVRAIPTSAAASFTPRWFRENVRLARRSGATRVYLWGVEWWAYLRDARGDPALWTEGQQLLRGS